MSRYDEQYYIAFPVNDDRYPELMPDQKTADRRYRYRFLTPGMPLFFSNGFQAELAARGIKETLGDILFDSPDILVGEKLKDYLTVHDILGMQLYPAVYIDMRNNYREGFWFLNFYERLDCWSREQSEYESEDDPDEAPSVDKYSLSDAVLDQIPEEKRLLFKMGGASVEYVFVHHIVVDYCKQQQVEGANFVKVSDFREGLQHRL